MFETVLHAGIFAARATHRRHAPRKTARHLLLGGRRLAGRSGPAIRARRRCSPRIGGERPKGLLLTHIHFDHAGAAGALVRRWPDLPVYVHERGAPHLADPAKLVASAARLYGGIEGLNQLWGEVVPVPEENLKILEGGEKGLEGAFTVEYTPGHASHHVCYLHESSGMAFVGDMAGVRVPPEPFTLAPTPPPDIDVEKWEASLETIAALGAEGARPHPLGPGRRPARAARARAREPQRAGRVRRAARRGRLRRGLLRAASTRTPARPPTRSSRRRRPTSFSWASGVI